MTIQYTVYENSTGKILRTGTAMTEASAMAQGSRPGTSVKLVGSDPVTDTVTPGEAVVVPRAPLHVNGSLTASNKTAIVANGIEELRVSNIPAGATGSIFVPANKGLLQADDFIINDGVLLVTTTVKGIYSIKIAFQNFLDFTVTFNAS